MKLTDDVWHPDFRGNYPPGAKIYTIRYLCRALENPPKDSGGNRLTNLLRPFIVGATACTSTNVYYANRMNSQFYDYFEVARTPLEAFELWREVIDQKYLGRPTHLDYQKWCQYADEIIIQLRVDGHTS